MFFRRKDWRKRSVIRHRIQLIAKGLLGIFLAFSFSYFFLETIQNVRPKIMPKSISSTFSLSDIETIPDANAAVCVDPKQKNGVEAFLYQDEGQINVIGSEAVNPDLAEKTLNYPIKKEDKTINDIEMDKIENTYEEELPEDIFEDELDQLSQSDERTIQEQGTGYHVYHGQKTVNEMGIIPPKKPWYFGNTPVMAIVIDDMGVSPLRSQDIISLPYPITLSFLTYSKYLKPQIEAAQKAGHEIMIHMPMQAKTNKDAAPDVLKVDMSVDEIKDRAEKMLSEFEGVSGVNNHMGSLFTENAECLGAVMEVLHNHNMFFLDSKTSAQSAGKTEAVKHGVRYAHRHVFLDNENNVEYITKQLELALNLARRNGYVVAIGHPKSGTYQALKEWLPKMEEKGIKLIPMSKIVDVLNIPG